MRRCGHTFAAVTAIVAYAYALGVAPWLHVRHHALHGEDHVHDASGTHAIEPGGASTHEAFHADLAALGLDDAATAGTLAVDCSLSAYTLTECDATAHAPRFGDALAARHHAPKAPDPLHGQGALEHLAKSLLCPTPVVLPPPSAPYVQLALLFSDAQLDSIGARAPQARGPPA